MNLRMGVEQESGALPFASEDLRLSTVHLCLIGLADRRRRHFWMSLLLAVFCLNLFKMYANQETSRLKLAAKYLQVESWVPFETLSC